MRIRGNAWSQTKAHNIAKKANAKLRDARGIGGVVRRLEDSKIGSKVVGVAAANQARKYAMAKNAANNLSLADHNARNEAEHMNARSLQNAMAAADKKLQERLVNEEAEGIKTQNSLTLSDGTQMQINTNDLKDMGDNLDRLVAHYESIAGNPNTSEKDLETTRNQIDALKQVIRSRVSGSKAAVKTANSLYNSFYDPSTKRERTDFNDDQKKARSNLARRMMSDSALMGELHKADPGTEQFIMDLANAEDRDSTGALTQAAIDARGRLANGREGYAKLSAGKVKLSNLPDATDTLLDNMKTMDATLPEHHKLIQSFGKALRHETIGGMFNADDVAKIKTEAKRGYNTLLSKAQTLDPTSSDHANIMQTLNEAMNDETFKDVFSQSDINNIETEMKRAHMAQLSNASGLDPTSSDHAQVVQSLQDALDSDTLGNSFTEDEIKTINREAKRSYDTKRAEWMMGTNANGVSNISSLSGYIQNASGDMVKQQADGVDADGDLYCNLRDSSGAVIGRQKLLAQANASAPALKADYAYSQQVDYFNPIKRGQQQFKIQQEQKAPELPSGWDANGNWTNTMRAATNLDRAAYQNWVSRKVEVDQHNEEVRRANSKLADDQKAFELWIHTPGGGPTP